MAIDLNDVMDEIGVALSTVPGLRWFDFPPNSAVPPFAFPDMPEGIEFDHTYARGTDKTTIRVFVGLARNVDRSYRDQISEFVPLIKAALDATDVAAVRCESADFAPITLAGATYAGAVFTVSIWN